MILVNNPGSRNYVYPPLSHAEWHGLTPTDLVFPFFMVIMGVSTFMSLRKFDFTPSSKAVWKITRRSVLIFMIGLGLGWFGQFTRGLANGESLVTAATHFDTLRILGVLQRLGLAYGLAALIALTVKHKNLVGVVVALLLGYFLVLMLGNGFEMSEQNILSVIDRSILGENHVYHDKTPEGKTIAFEILGLLSTLPAISQVLIGILLGKLIAETKENRVKVERLLIWGTIMAFAGLLLQYGCPINKKIWSPTFVLTTTGFAAQLLGLLIWIIDINGKRKWSRFFHSFGINPLIVYVFAGILANLFGNIQLPYSGGSISIKGFLYSVMLQPWAGDYIGSLLYAILFVSICWAFGYILYKKKIYIKL